MRTPGPGVRAQTTPGDTDRVLVRSERVAAAFRLAAHVEAATWAGLLIGMAFKYVLADNEIGVKIFGPIHGAAFVGYVTVTFLAARTFGWNIRFLLAALLASIPPLTTWPFERYASRRGRLIRD